MSEAGDHLSQASISDLSKQMDGARSGDNQQGSAVTNLISLFSNLPGGEGAEMTREMNDMQNMRTTDPSQMTPQEIHQNIWKVLTWRDGIMKRIEVS